MEYKFNPDTNMYAIYSTGYRPGGYNTSVTNAAFIPYGQESAENFEAGVKMRFLDGRAGLNFTVFRMNQKDLTVQQDDPTDTKFGFSYLSNVGSATTNGFELESMARLSKSLGASFSVGYLDAKYTQGTINAGTAGAFDVTGRELSGVRPWTLNAKLDFKQPVSGSTEFFGAIGVRRESGGAIGDHSEIPMEALTKIDLNAGLNFSKKTQLTAFIHNATNQQVTLFRFTNGAVGTNIGRRFGIQLTHQY
jgi:iron complex outermembrane receptor protein